MTSQRLRALAGRADPLQLAAGLVFLLLAALVVVLQVRSSLDLVDRVEPPGAKVGRRWWALYALVAVVVAAGAALLPRRLLWAPAALGGLALAATLVAVAAGGEVWSLAVALLTLTGALALGVAALRAPGLRRGGLDASGLASLAVGLGLLGLVVFLLGLVGLIRWWTVGLLVVAAGVIGLVYLGRRERWTAAALSQLWSTRLGAGALGILGLQGAYAAVWAGAPEIQYDSLQYKAWLPYAWAAGGSIDADVFRNSPTTVYLGLAQLDAAPGHTLGAHGVGRYLQLALAGLIVVVAWRLGRRVAPALGPIAAIVVGTAPIVVWQAATAYDDLFLTALVLGAAAAVLHYEGRRVASPLAASAVIGFLAGTCITGKLHLVPFAVALVLAWLVVSPEARQLGPRALGLAAGLAAGAAPLLAYRWAITDNPVFPYYNDVFRSPYFETAEGITDFRGAGGDSPWTWLWRLVEGVVPGSELPTRGVLGLLVPAAIVGLLFGWRGGGARRAVWAATATAAIVWWIQFQVLRFVLPYAILAALLSLPALAALGCWMRSRVAAVAAVGVATVAAAALVIATAAAFWNVPGGFPLAVATGVESRDTYVERVLPEVVAIDWLNEHAGRGDLVVGASPARLLLRPDLRYELDYEFDDRLELAVARADGPDDVRRAVEATGLDWVVVDGGDRDLQKPSVLAQVLHEDGHVAFADFLHDVYRLGGRAEPAAPVELCDPALVTPSCWFGGALPDTTPGLSAQELGGQPVGTTVPACAGATYRLEATAGEGASPWIVFFVFDVTEPEQSLRSGDVHPGLTSVLYQTAPAGATSLSIVLQPAAADAAPITGLSLAIVDQLETGSPCT